MKHDDNQVATIVSQCRNVMEEYSTTTNITAAYNLLVIKFRLACVQGDKKDLEKMAKDIHDGLLEEIGDL